MADEMREDAQEKLLAQVMRYCPTVRQVIERDGQRTLDDYLDQLADFPAARPLSPPQDVSDCARAQLAPLLGDEIAAEAAQGLVDSAFTATHHGVDYFAPSVQGSLLYRHLLEKRGISCQAVPLLGFGTVSLCNASYGRGFLLYDVQQKHPPLKLPVIPSKYENSAVCFFPGVTAEMLCSCEESLHRISRDVLSPEMVGAVEHILRDHYGQPAVLNASDYVSQATLINYSLSQEAAGVGTCYLDAERLASALILRDLEDPDSLVSLTLRDHAFRRTLYDALDGVSGCWRLAALRSGVKEERAKGGTMLFWGRAAKNYRRAQMIDDGTGFVNGSGNDRISYSDLADALQRGSLLPGLFMVFLVLLFARDFRCFGGYFQADYLAKMQQGLCKALRATGRAGLAEVIAARETSGYLSGPLFLTNARGTPLSMAELIAHPLTKAALTEKLALSLHDAHLAGIGDLYQTVVPPAERMKGWEGR